MEITSAMVIGSATSLRYILHTNKNVRGDRLYYIQYTVHWDTVSLTGVVMMILASWISKKSSISVSPVSSLQLRPRGPNLFFQSSKRWLHRALMGATEDNRSILNQCSSSYSFHFIKCYQFTFLTRRMYWCSQVINYLHVSNKPDIKTAYRL